MTNARQMPRGDGHAWNWLSHYERKSKKHFSRKLNIIHRFNTYQKSIFKQFLLRKSFPFVIQCLEFLISFWVTRHLHGGRESCQVKKSTFSLGRFCYLDNYCVRKSITLIFKSFSTDEFTLSKQNSVTDVCVEFRPSCWCSSVWAPIWRLHTKLYNFG